MTPAPIGIASMQPSHHCHFGGGHFGGRVGAFRRLFGTKFVDCPHAVAAGMTLLRSVACTAARTAVHRPPGVGSSCSRTFGQSHCCSYGGAGGVACGTNQRRRSLGRRCESQPAFCFVVSLLGWDAKEAFSFVFLLVGACFS